MTLPATFQFALIASTTTGEEFVATSNADETITIRPVGSTRAWAPVPRTDTEASLVPGGLMEFVFECTEDGKRLHPPTAEEIQEVTLQLLGAQEAHRSAERSLREAEESLRALRATRLETSKAAETARKYFLRTTGIVL